MHALQVQVEAQRAVRISGELDLWTAPQLRDALLPLLSSDGDLVVDLAAVDFIDGAGLRPLLLAARRLEGRGRVVLRSPSSSVSRVLSLIQAEQIRNLEIWPRLAEPADRLVSRCS
jgi:anti-sigma B factor antagonist